MLLIDQGIVGRSAPGGDWSLIASKCRECGDLSFPKLNRCKNPACLNPDVEVRHLGAEGRLESFTVQHYEPPPPFVADQPFRPFGIGLIELDDGIMILGRIRTDDVGLLAVGMQVRLRVAPTITTSDQGEDFGWYIDAEVG